MSAVKKFMFNRDFDTLSANSAHDEQAVEDADDQSMPEENDLVEEEAEAEAEVEIEPGYSEDQMAAAKAEAFEAGKQDGAKNAAETIEQASLTSLQAISSHITELFGEQEQANNALLRDGIAVATALTRKLFPHLDEQNGLGEIERLIEHTLLRLIEEPRVVVRVFPDLLKPLSERLEELRAGSGYEGRLILKEDKTLTSGDCRLEWGDGSAERNTAALWASIDHIIESNLGKIIIPEPVSVEQEDDITTPTPENVDEPASHATAALTTDFPPDADTHTPDIASEPLQESPPEMESSPDITENDAISEIESENSQEIDAEGMNEPAVQDIVSGESVNDETVSGTDETAVSDELSVETESDTLGENTGGDDPLNEMPEQSQEETPEESTPDTDTPLETGDIPHEDAQDQPDITTHAEPETEPAADIDTGNEADAESDMAVDAELMDDTGQDVLNADATDIPDEVADSVNDGDSEDIDPLGTDQTENS